MCRVLAYLGTPVLLDDLLYKSDSSLIKQTYQPRMLAALNLAGFGMAAWDPASHDAERPFIYRHPDLPVFDRNLKRLAEKLKPTCIIAHVRGVPYGDAADIGVANLHPFSFRGCNLVLAHNGDLARFSEMRSALIDHVKPEFAAQIRGSTDSEWIYAVLASKLEQPDGEHSIEEIVDAVERTLMTFRDVRHRCGIDQSSSANLFVSNGRDLVATRFTFDYGCYADTVEPTHLSYLSLWFTVGRDYGYRDGEWKMTGLPADADSLIVASEPLSHDVSTWVEVPEYSLLYVQRRDDRLRVRTYEFGV